MLLFAMQIRDTCADVYVCTPPFPSSSASFQTRACLCVTPSSM